ncbi:MAG: hypothetical protein AB8B74_06860 [Crocinitomicaceae bacterium]
MKTTKIMLKDKLSLLILSLVFIISFNSCDDKININADYSATPIVFSLLDHRDSVHLVKITKTFLGDGNNYDFAKVADSSYWKQVDAKIVELNEGVATGREWALKDSTIKDKNSGIFYGPEQRVYVFYENGLKEDHQYKLEATLDEGDYSIDATTDLIDGFKYSTFFTGNPGSPPPNLSFGSVSSAGVVNYNFSFVRYSEGKYGAGYQTRLIFRYKENYLDGTEAIKEIIWNAKENNGFDDIDPEFPKPSRSVSFAGEGFYTFIASKITSNDNIDTRQFVDIDVITEVGHIDLMDYIEILKPSTGIAQNQPLYTNINGGLGLFSSRTVARVNNIGLTAGSIEVLCTRGETGALKFCSTNQEHNSESFFCN